MTILMTRKGVHSLTAFAAGLGLVALASTSVVAADKPAIEVITHLSLIHI